MIMDFLYNIPINKYTITMFCLLLFLTIIIMMEIYIKIRTHRKLDKHYDNLKILNDHDIELKGFNDVNK